MLLGFRRYQTLNVGHSTVKSRKSTDPSTTWIRSHIVADKTYVWFTSVRSPISTRRKYLVRVVKHFLRPIIASKKLQYRFNLQSEWYKKRCIKSKSACTTFALRYGLYLNITVNNINYYVPVSQNC